MPKKQARKVAGVKRAKAPPPPKTEDLFVSTLSLEGVRLIESHSKLTVAEGQVPTQAQVAIEVKTGANPPAKFLGDVFATITTPEGSASSLLITVQFQCVFNVPSLPDPSTLTDIEKKAINSAVLFVAWPYIRAHVSSLTSSMGIPTFTIPLIKPDFSELASLKP